MTNQYSPVSPKQTFILAILNIWSTQKKLIAYIPNNKNIT